jgi:CheY-like chemotaxis protein
MQSGLFNTDDQARLGETYGSVDHSGMAMDQATALLKILVVDDNADAAFLVAELLRMRGHRVEVATGGFEGFAAATATLPDVVLLDIGMPGMDGYQVATALRNGELTRGVKIIALTAWGDAESRARAARCGFDRHLVKPANFCELFEAVEVAA